MVDERFVLTTIETGTTKTECWGLFSEEHSEFTPVWTRDHERWDRITHELGDELGELNVDSGGVGLTENELRAIVDANDSNTPDEAWAALAHWRLTGERIGTPQVTL